MTPRISLVRFVALVWATTLLLAACSGEEPAATTTASGETVSAAGSRNGESAADADAGVATTVVAPPASTAQTTTTVSATTTTSPPTTTTSSSTTTTSTTTTTTSPPTTTTTTTTTTTPVASPSTGPIGVIGCSNTHQAVDGYRSLSTIDALTPGDLGGGSVPRWGLPGGDRYGFYWGLYDSRRPGSGYGGTWLQLCLRSGEHGGAFDDAEKTWISHIIEQIHARDPGITVWVSPLNFYAEGHVCTSAGVDGPAISAEAADWAAAGFANVSRGPNLGPLEPSHIGVRDDCHPNDAGEALLGQQLVAFFD